MFTIFLSISSIAQSTFEVFIPSETRTGSYMAIDDGNGGIITPVNNLTEKDYGPSEYIRGYLLMISSSGDTSSHRYSFHDTVFFLNRIHHLTNGGYILTGESVPPGSTGKCLLMAGLDEEFNMQWAKHYAYEYMNNRLIVDNIFQVGDTLIMPVGRCEFPCGATYPMFIKTDLDGNIYQETFYDTTLLRAPSHSFILGIDNKTLYMFADAFVGGVTGPSYSTFNENFEYVSTLPLAPQDYSLWRVYNTWSPDSVILMSYVAGRPGATIYDEDVWLASYDTAFNLLNRVSFGTADTMDYTPYTGIGIGCIQPDTIFFSGYKNATGWPPHITMVSWIMAGQVDSELQLRYLHYLGGDAYYEPRYMLPLNDGGFLIHAAKFNHNTRLHDMYFIKLNREGLITSNKTGLNLIKRAFLSPNPAKEYLSVECWLTSAEAILFSLTGVEITTFKLEQGTTMLPLQNLKPGMYLLNISVPGKGVIETHKYIKL
jgi:hypothetical protein